MTIGYLFAQNGSNKQKPEEMLIEGEVVDLACFTSRELSGEGHKSCAMRCLTRGTPAGLVDQDGNVFVIIGPSPGYAPYAAQTIRLNGSVEGGRISPKKNGGQGRENMGGSEAERRCSEHEIIIRWINRRFWIE